MLPLILGGAVLAGGALWLFGSDHKASPSDGVPQKVINSVAAALKSDDPEVMQSVAAQLRSQGYAAQAASLEDAAKELQAAITSTPAAKPGKALEPVKGKGATRVNPAPRADDPQARRQAGQLAQLLTSITPADARTSAAVKAAVTDFQRLEKSRRFYVGNIDGLYGPKTAIVFAQDHGIVPPRPLFWSKKDPKGAKAVYVAQLQRFADADPQRREEWQQAQHVDAD